eukprot:TRINITY_DN1654_c0_g6_i1.p1 TRINITY_DN1654_c0_g6~~TRINITY_DN1654_c0_g6_i1.p1  ORF type:complete len:373 (-),score=55.73 TRINITY_DN1654_c0_g6_i1:654-1772(-)
MKTGGRMDIPRAIEFGYCRVGIEETRKFRIANQSAATSKFAILSEIFTFSPRQGKRCAYHPLATLRPGQKVEVAVSCVPHEAKTVIEAVRVNLNNDWKTIKVTAIGKYPYVALNTHKLDFGELLTGQTLTREITFRNPSSVPAEFEIKKENEDADVLPAFTLDCCSGTIPPNSSFLVKVKYLPTVVGLCSCVHFKARVKGGNEDTFTCLGQALGLQVSLSTKSVQFGEVTLGKSNSRVIYVQNNSSQRAVFQFVNDKKNVFAFSKREGVVEAKSDFRVVITFCPTDTINFYERVFCIVQNHMILVSVWCCASSWICLGHVMICCTSPTPYIKDMLICTDTESSWELIKEKRVSRQLKGDKEWAACAAKVVPA